MLRRLAAVEDTAHDVRDSIHCGHPNRLFYNTIEPSAVQAATVVIKPCLKHSQSAGVLDFCRPSKPSLAGRTREAEEVLQVLKGDGPPNVRLGASCSNIGSTCC